MTYSIFSFVIFLNLEIINQQQNCTLSVFSLSGSLSFIFLRFKEKDNFLIRMLSYGRFLCRKFSLGSSCIQSGI